VAAGLAGVVFAVAPAPAPASAVPVCGARGAPTIKREGNVRVYAGRFRGENGQVHKRTVACVKGGRRVALDDPWDAYNRFENSFARRRSIVIAGGFVAYASDTYYGEGVDFYSATLFNVADLRTGDIQSDCPSGSDHGCARARKPVTDIVLRRTGAAAFVAKRELSLLSSHGRASVLSRNADPGSLRLHGARLSWTEDGRHRTAQVG
jgi:hypothetical protein